MYTRVDAVESLLFIYLYLYNLYYKSLDAQTDSREGAYFAADDCLREQITWFSLRDRVPPTRRDDGRYLTSTYSESTGRFRIHTILWYTRGYLEQNEMEINPIRVCFPVNYARARNAVKQNDTRIL